MQTSTILSADVHHRLAAKESVSDIFFFSARGRGRGSSWRQEGAGVGFLLKIPGGWGGGCSHERGGEARGREGVCGEFWGGAKYFFSGPKCPPRIERGEKTPKTPKISAPLRKRPVLLRADLVLTKDRKRPYYGHFCGKMHREGSCSKAAGGP